VELTVLTAGGEPNADYRDFTATAHMIEAGRAAVASALDRVGSPR